MKNQEIIKQLVSASAGDLLLITRLSPDARGLPLTGELDCTTYSKFWSKAYA